MACCSRILHGVVPDNFSEISSSISGAIDFKMSSAAWGTSGIAGTDTADDFFHLSTGAQAWSLLCLHDPVQNGQTND